MIAVDVETWGLLAGSMGIAQLLSGKQQNFNFVLCLLISNSNSGVYFKFWSLSWANLKPSSCKSPSQQPITEQSAFMVCNDSPSEGFASGLHRRAGAMNKHHVLSLSFMYSCIHVFMY